MASSDSDSDSIWIAQMFNAVSKKQGKGKKISEQDRCREVKESLDQGADLNAVDHKGNTVLHLAVNKGYVEAVRFLQQNGAKVDVRNHLGYTAITLAENSGDHEKIASILKNHVERKTNPTSAGRLTSARQFLRVDDARPSTSWGSHLLVRDPLQDENTQFSRSTEGLKPKAICTDDGFDESTRKRRLEPIDGSKPCKFRRIDADDTVTEASTSGGLPRVGRNGKEIIQSAFSNAEKTYSTSGLKRSLHGNIYQLKHLMLILHRAWRMGYAFRLSTEMDAAEKFDDLVLHYRDSAGKELHRFLQIKHKQDKTKVIDARQLLDVKDGEFSVLKYFISWRKIKKHSEFAGSVAKNFILCTNIGLDVESLKEAGIGISPVYEPDDFLKVMNRREQPPRYKLIIETGSRLNDTLKTASDAHSLARELAERVYGSKDIYLNTDIMKCYHVALAEEVVDIRSKKFSHDFIKNQNLSAKAENFREIFFLHVKKLSRRNVSDDDIWKDLEGSRLKLSTTFGKKFEPTTQPQLTDVRRFSQEFVNLLKKASDDNVVKIDRRTYNKGASDSSVERIVADNIDKLAGHVLITENGRIKFRSQFLNDATKLLGNVEEFRTSLESELRSGLEELDKFSFEINNFKTCTEEELSSTTTLPDDDIDDGEISDFLNDFVFAVDQPNEVELGKIIKQELGADSQFNLLSADLIGDSFQNVILNWFKETGKRGRFLEAEDAVHFFNEVEVKLSSLIAMGLSLEYPEVLKNYGVELKRDIKEVQKFINSSNSTSPQILEIISSEHTLLTCLKVHQTITRISRYEKNDSFIFIRLKTLSLRKVMTRVLRAFEWPHNHDLLVIDCESINPNQYAEELWHPLSDIMEENPGKLMILIRQEDTELAVQFQVRYGRLYEEKHEVSIDKLIENSREKLLNELIISFQGQDERTSFRRLLRIDELGATGTEHFEDLGQIIDLNTLVKLIKNEDIRIGGEIQGLGEISDWYMNRRIFQHVVIKEDILEDQDMPDLLAISGIHAELPNKLNSSVAQNMLPEIFSTSNIGGHPSDGSKNTEEASSVERHRKNFTILTSAQEEEQFELLCAQNVQRNVHWLKKDHLGKYTWQRSQGDITYLLKYKGTNDTEDRIGRKRARYLSEDQLSAHNQPVIISDSAGMGKSTMLTRLAWKIKRNEPEKLVLKIDLNHHSTALAEVKKNSSYDLRDIDEAVKFLLNEILKPENDLEKKVFRKMIKELRKLVLIFDGFDEISPTYEGTVISLLESLANYGIRRLFVATRPHTREKLERKLKAFSYEIEPLSILKQEEFLTKFWRTRLGLGFHFEPKTEDRMKKYAKAMINKLANWITDQSNDFTGIPLQTRLVAEIFENQREGEHSDFDSCKEFIQSELDLPKFPEKINLVYLYKRFVDKKFDIFFKKRGGNLEDLAVLEDKRLRYIRFIDTHQELAIHALFEDDKIKDLLPSRRDMDHRSLEEVNIGIVDERTGIVTQFIDGRPQFGHRTYAEYFAATFLLKMLRKDGQIQSLSAIFVADILLRDDYRTLRAFMNWLLSDEHENTFDGDSWKASINENRSLLSGTIFHVAAAEGNDRIIRLFLNCLRDNPEDRNTLVNVKDGIGRTALHWAAGNGQLDGLKLLLEQSKFEIDFQDAMDMTPLQIAARTGKLEVIEYLLDKGATINHQSNKGTIPLHAAAQNGDMEAVKYLLAKDANVNLQALDGRSSLHIAIEFGTLDMIKYLLNDGAKINLQTNWGLTPISVASFVGELEVVEYLLENGAKINSPMQEAISPLHLAANAGNLKIVKYLLAKGAIIDAQTNEGATALHLAVQGKSVEVIKYLIDMGANVNSETKKGFTPLCIASSLGKLEVVKYLLEVGAGVDSEIAPLYAAASTGRLEVVKYLLEKGAIINSQTHEGATALHIAAQGNSMEVVKYLVDNRADVNSKTMNGSTPLSIASSLGKLEVVKYLLENGAATQSSSTKVAEDSHGKGANGKLEVVSWRWEPTLNLRNRQGWRLSGQLRQAKRLED